MTGEKRDTRQLMAQIAVRGVTLLLEALAPAYMRPARLNVVRAQLATNGQEAVQRRRRQFARVGDVSQSIQKLKQWFLSKQHAARFRFPYWGSE